MIEELSQEIDALEKKRSELLAALREKCQHLKLAELGACPPHRICLTCGAEERGWWCGYHALIIPTDTWYMPDMPVRIIMHRSRDSCKFWNFRKPGERYLVGQSHPDFGKKKKGLEA